jgi:hypothetical protein
MFDFTRVARACGMLLLAYLALFPVLAVGYAVWGVVSDAEGRTATAAGWLVWPGPVAFVVASVVLLADYARRFRARTMTTTQVTGYRAAGLLQVVGSLFALSTGHYWVPAACFVVWSVLLAPAKRRAQPSTWEGA